MESILEPTNADTQLPAFNDDDDKTYYQDIIRYLQEGKFPDSATEVYRKQIQKRSTKHFMHEGILYFKKRRHSLKVIIGREERTQLLQSLHINPKTGAHLGLRKVHDALVQSYYWRTCYTDASLIVKHCAECSETAPLNLPKNEDLSLDMEPATNTNSVWQRLELRVHGPYPPTGANHTHVVSILDSSSGWVTAAALRGENLAAEIARFLFQTWCDFGPAPCFVQSDAFLLEQVQANLAGKMLGSLSFHQLLRQASDSSAPGGLATKWIPKLEELIFSRPNDWDDQLAEFLWQLRATPRDNMQLSAFVIMFGREPNDNSSGVALSSDHMSTAASVEPAPEEITAQMGETSTAIDSVPPTRRRLRSAIWQCRHCSQVSTSKISFNIHQRMHTEEAKRRGALDGEEPLRTFTENQKITRKPFLRKKSRLSRWAELARARARHTLNNAAAAAPTADSNRPEANTDDTVAAVKALLALTKEERCKRGKYRRYTPELRDEIARYAISRGVCDTTRVYSTRLGFNVSESSVRNFVKAYTNFTPELKEEIGKSAVQSGMETTQQLYASKLGRDLRPAIIRKFKRLYLRKHPELHQPDSSSSPVSSQRQANSSLRGNANKTSSAVIRTKRVFCPSMKDEIGRFAAEHGIAATLQHYTDKLQFAVKESTVRKFRKKYLDSTQAAGPRSPEPIQDKEREEVFFPSPAVSGCLESEMEVMHQQPSSLTLLHPSQHPPYSNNPSSAPFHPLPPPPPFPPQLCPSREVAHYGPLPTHSQIDHNNLESSQVAVPSAAYDCPPLYSHACNYPVPLTNQPQLSEYTEPSPLAFHHHPGHNFSASQQRQRASLAVAIGSQQPSISNPNAYNPVYHVANSTGAVSHVNLVPQHPSHMLLPPPPTFQQHLSMANSHHHHHASAQSLPPQPAILPLPLSLERKNATATDVENGEEAAILPGSSSSTVAGDVPLYPQQQHPLRKSDADKNLITVPSSNSSFHPSHQHVALLSAPSYSHHQLQPNKGTHQHRDLLAEAAAVATAPDLQQQQQPPLPGLSVAALTSSISAGATEPAVALGRPQRYRRTNARNDAHAEQDNADREGYYHTEDEEEEEVDEPDSYEADERVTRRTKQNRAASQPRRGNYACYSPELRAEIGKYAIEHGNQKAMLYFKDKLGLDIPESTIRGLRDKYVVKRVQRGEKEVTSLGFAQRGRPMRLGKYDGMVQDCIRQLIKSGEKISSFLCIATAKQVLMQHEPALLEENGGPIKLNPTWAKSFLKRMGANNLA